ncbi:MAG: pectate lyase [Paludibacteraceae bacterium]|nr:pectate lyase [Paludibacteraceae bacterium]
MRKRVFKITNYEFLLAFLLCLLTPMLRAEVQITNAGGWYESAYVEWAPVSGVIEYEVSVIHWIDGVEGGAAESWVIDEQLIRSYGSYFRADALGLKSGTYQLLIFPKATDEPGMASGVPPLATTDMLTVKAYDRNGFAHFNYPQGVGAYKNDGTLKDGAKVLYIHAGNAKTVEMDVTVDKKGTKRHCVGLQHIISAYEKGYAATPLDIRLIGTLDSMYVDSIGSKEEGLQIKGNKDMVLDITLEGVGNDAVLRGIGILVRGAASVELRNFAVMSAMDDCISLDTNNDHIWVHHIDGFYSKPGKDKDQAKGDGTIDVKSNSKHVTVSYNHFWDTGKSAMCGMKSESGPNYITYHHNWFDHSDSRHPRLRTMSVHIYNNYFDGIAKYGVGATYGASGFVENNYFRNCSHPMLISMQGTDTKNGADEKDSPTFSKEDGGILKAYNNVFTGSKTPVYYNAETNPEHFDAYPAQTRDEKVPETVKTKQGGHTYDNFDTNPELMPAITPDAAEDVPAIVTGEWGAGRMQHGDVRFEFASSDDTSYEKNNALANLIVNYQSALKGIQGEDMPAPQAIEAVREDKDLRYDGQTIYNPAGKVIRVYAINGACLGSTNSTMIGIEYLPSGMYVVVSKDGSLKIKK